MSGRLDQSLDSIIDSQKKAKREVQRRRKAGKPVKAPVGGVKKSQKPAKPAIKPATGAGAQPKASKIVVSGLPYDVNEAQIKEYFTKSVGSVKKVALQYNQSGQSRGIADIIFGKSGLAAKAAKDLNGMLVDKRPMKASKLHRLENDFFLTSTQIEVVVDADSVPEPAPPKSLADRVAANPKAQPKSATSTKATARDGTKGRSAGKPGKPRRGKNARPKPKTAEELDAEMTDYWGANNAGAATNTTTEATGAAVNGAATTGEDLGMDEIS